MHEPRGPTKSDRKRLPEIPSINNKMLPKKQKFDSPYVYENNPQ